jgi:hypothetical protein
VHRLVPPPERRRVGDGAQQGRDGGEEMLVVPAGACMGREFSVWLAAREFAQGAP